VTRAAIGGSIALLDPLADTLLVMIHGKDLRFSDDMMGPNAIVDTEEKAG
jgi:hypothetical protein